MLLYYITDRSQFAGDEVTRRKALLAKIGETTRAGVDYVQLREKDLSTRDLEGLARDAIRVIRENNSIAKTNTRFLLNSRTDVALAVGADGVHLRSDDVHPEDVRDIIRHAANSSAFVIATSCHSPEEVRAAASGGARFAVFAPVFEKQGAPAALVSGLERLAEACRAAIPTVALGGVTLENAGACIEAGAAGIAAIRLFQENNVEEVVRALTR
jgi:thiamine-phosphate pyrophosphorylase